MKAGVKREEETKNSVETQNYTNLSPGWWRLVHDATDYSRTVYSESHNRGDYSLTTQANKFKSFETYESSIYWNASQLTNAKQISNIYQSDWD